MRTASVALLFSSSVVAPVLARGANTATADNQQAVSSTQAAGATREQGSVAQMDSATPGVMGTSN